MRKYSILVVFLLINFIPTFCQYTELRRLDSLTVDSLRTSLPGLQGQQKVNALNKLGQMFAGFYAIGGFTHRADSMYHYALEAKKEASQINYNYGMAKSLLILSFALKNIRFSTQGEMDPAEKKYLLQAIQIGEELHNDSILGSGYYLLAGHEEMEGNYKKAIAHFQKAGDLQNETEVTTWLCMLYSNKGQYEEGFPYCDKCIQLARKNASSNKNDWAQELVQWSLYDMAELYKAAGDYETTLDYYMQFNQYAAANSLSWTISIDKSKAEIFLLKSQFDSALYYWKKLEKNQGSNLDSRSPGERASDDASLGLIYLKTGQTEKALPLFTESTKTFYEMGKKMSGYSMVKPLLYTGEVYILKKDFAKALSYTKEAYALSQEDNRKPLIMSCYQLLSRIYDNMGKYDSAYFYLLNYTKLKDSIFNRQFLWRLNNYKKAAENAKKEARLGFLDRDNKIKEQKLKQQATLRNSLIAGILLLFLLGLFVFRNFYLKRKRQQAEDEKKQTELEMQALRAQMNPHFIFNCLSSINRIIMKNDNAAASDYLTRFSRLMRMVLINSQRQLISLEDELQMLRLYLDMERLRFKESFVYSIIFTNTIDEGAVQVPPLLLQPFCENAIWHGLMQKDGPGKLTVELSMRDNTLNCIITDNGIGREKAQERKSKTAEREKSMGLKITAERLALLNREKELHTYYEIEDLKDETGNAAGTRVNLKINYKETAESNFDQRMLTAEKKSKQR